MMRRMLLLLALLAAPTAAAGEDVTIFAAPGTERHVLTLDTATDLAAFQPLILAFQREEPDVTIRYREMVTNTLFERVRQECADGRRNADLVITSSVDHLVVLANEGCARAHRSAETLAAPAWTRWRDEIFGFTFEPAVIVYNRALMAREEVPRTRLALIELMREQPVRLAGRIGGYDIARSGIGYLFAAFDARNALVYGRLIEGFGRLNLVTRCCSGDLIQELAEGRLHLAYNLLGSYAYAAQRQGAPIGIVLPEDYVLVLSRGAMIPVRGGEPALARRFLDFLLSPRGQKVVREEAFFFDVSGAVPEGVEAAAPVLDAGNIRPIVIGPGLLPMQDRARRIRFLREWAKAIERSPAGE
ncbi:MAG: ABC transporter substrate-binding protein [Hyphomicrobiales bacterium]|nr:ABC transporter substrate-binding protein [Hyphomicrobiales bacterium]